jgi:hypothetical protein
MFRLIEKDVSHKTMDIIINLNTLCNESYLGPKEVHSEHVKGSVKILPFQGLAEFFPCNFVAPDLE